MTIMCLPLCIQLCLTDIHRTHIHSSQWPRLISLYWREYSLCIKYGLLCCFVDDMSKGDLVKHRRYLKKCVFLETAFVLNVFSINIFQHACKNTTQLKHIMAHAVPSLIKIIHTYFLKRSEMGLLVPVQLVVNSLVPVRFEWNFR